MKVSIPIGTTDPYEQVIVDDTKEIPVKVGSQVIGRVISAEMVDGNLVVEMELPESLGRLIGVDMSSGIITTEKEA